MNSDVSKILHSNQGALKLHLQGLGPGWLPRLFKCAGTLCEDRNGVLVVNLLFIRGIREVVAKWMHE